MEALFPSVPVIRIKIITKEVYKIKKMTNKDQYEANTMN